MALKPKQPTPALDLPLTAGGRFNLQEQSPQAFTMLVFYRGLHCPACKAYLQELSETLSQFTDIGVSPVAISADGAERAKQSYSEWGLGDLPVAYDLSIDAARAWGLFVSEAIKDGEPPVFSEPGIFLVRPDGTLYMAAINTMPFGRPRLEDVRKAAAFAIDKDYPPRGEA